MITNRTSLSYFVQRRQQNHTNFGLKRLDRIIAESVAESATAVKAAIASEWEDLLEDEEPFDDVTVLVLERLR
jgi:serine phosphatase RsbU (regulator of sigma subunit)